MSVSAVEKLTWTLIYGGLLAVVFGLFVEDRHLALGWVIAVAGGVAAAAGFVLIWVRARMKEPQ